MPSGPAASNSIILGNPLVRTGCTNRFIWKYGEGSKREFTLSNSPPDITLIDSLACDNTQMAEVQVATIASDKTQINSTNRDYSRSAVDADLPLDVKSLIIFEDNHVIVMNKSPCLLTQGDLTGHTNLLDLTKEYLIWRDNKPGAAYLGVDSRALIVESRACPNSQFEQSYSFDSSRMMWISNIF